VKNTKHPQNHILLLIHYNVKTCASTIRFYAVQESTGSVDWKLFCSRSALLHVRYTAVLKRLNYTHYIFMIWCQCLISDLLRWWLLPGKRDSMRNAGMATRRAGHISIKKEYESTLVYVSRNKQSLANNDKIVTQTPLARKWCLMHTVCTYQARVYYFLMGKSSNQYSLQFLQIPWITCDACCHLCCQA